MDGGSARRHDDGMVEPDGDSSDDGVLATLRRWEASGGTWQVVVRTPGRLELELLTCDGGEVMQRLRAAPPGSALEQHVAGRTSSIE